MSLKESTLQRIDEALRVVDDIEQVYKLKFRSAGIPWVPTPELIAEILDEASKITHYSPSTLKRYRGERPAKKGKFSSLRKDERLPRNNTREQKA